MQDIEKLQIRQALIDNYNCYAEGLDSKNWDLVRSCFAAQFYIDYGAISAASGDSRVARKLEDWMQHLQAVINSFDITRHTITNHRVVIDDTQVSCKAYLVADHVRFADATQPIVGPDDVVTVVGEYHNHYAHIDGAWRIVRSALAVNWTSGNLALFG